MLSAQERCLGTAIGVMSHSRAYTQTRHAASPIAVALASMHHPSEASRLWRGLNVEGA